MSALLLLLACAEGEKAPWTADLPGETADTGPADTAAGGDSAPEETGPPPDTGDPSPAWHLMGDAHLVVTSAGSDGAFGASQAVGDLDGDGVLDLALAFPGDDTHGRDAGAVHVYLGPVDADLAPGGADVVVRGSHGDPLEAVEILEDLDGDGRAELLARGSSGDRLLVGSRLARGATVDAAEGTSWSSETATVAWDDVDGDGTREVLYATETAGDTSDGLGVVAVLSGADLAAGVHTVVRELWLPMVYAPALHLVSDRDGDGLREVVVSWREGTSVLSSAALLAGEEAPSLQDVTNAEAVLPLGDADGDGLEDLLVDTHAGLGIVAASDGDVDAYAVVRLLAGPSTPASLGDVDGDGLVDLVGLVNDGGFLGLVRVSGAEVVAGGTFDRAAAGWSLAAWSSSYSSWSADGHGRVWVTSGEAAPTVKGVRGFDATGDGALELADASVVASWSGPHLPADGVEAAWLDADGDGADDLVLLGPTTPSGVARIPFATVAAGDTIGACDVGCVTPPGRVALLDDLDGDGLVEVLVQDDAHMTWRYPIDALVGGFDAPLSRLHEEGEPYVGDLAGLDAPDLTGDGVPDPICTLGPIDGATVLDGFGRADVLEGPMDLTGLGDLDGDGHDDAWRDFGWDDPVYGGATFGAEGEPGVLLALHEDEARVVGGGATDVDGDGRADLPLALPDAAGWLTDLGAPLTASELALGVSSVTDPFALFAIPRAQPAYLLVGGTYGRERQLRVWRLADVVAPTPENAAHVLPLRVGTVLRADVDPVDGVGVAVLVQLPSEDGDGGSLRLFRFD